MKIRADWLRKSPNVALVPVRVDKCHTASSRPAQNCADRVLKDQLCCLLLKTERNRQLCSFSCWRSWCGPEIGMWFSVVGRTASAVSFSRAQLWERLLSGEVSPGTLPRMRLLPS